MLFAGHVLLSGAALTVVIIVEMTYSQHSKAAAIIPLTLNPEIVKNILDNESAS